MGAGLPDVIRSLREQNPKAIIRHWLWPVAPHVDPQKERMADRTGLENGDTTYADLCARNNRDWRDVIAERKEINDALAAPGYQRSRAYPTPARPPAWVRTASRELPAPELAMARIREGARSGQRGMTKTMAGVLVGKSSFATWGSTASTVTPTS